MNQRTMLGAACAAAISAGAAAQSLQIPPLLPDSGNTSQSSNWRGPRRHQVIVDASLLGAQSRLLRGIVLHVEPGSTAAGAPIDITVKLASDGVRPPEFAHPTSFAENVGAGLQLVSARRPIASLQGVGNRIPVPFDVPFSYTVGQPLLVQIEFDPTLGDPILNPVIYLDAHQIDSGYWQTKGVTSGSACPAPGTWRVFSDPYVDQLRFRYESPALQSGGVVALALGASTERFGGLALPQDMSFLGMTGCVLRASIDATYLSTAYGQGRSAVMFDVPVVRDPDLLSAMVHAQSLAFDPSANPAGLTISELRTEQLVAAPDAIQFAHLTDVLLPSVPMPIANLRRNHTLVFELQ